MAPGSGPFPAVLAPVGNPLEPAPPGTAELRVCRHRWVFGDIDPTTGVNAIKCERCGEPQPPEGVEGNLWTPPAP